MADSKNEVSENDDNHTEHKKTAMADYNKNNNNRDHNVNNSQNSAASPNNNKRCALPTLDSLPQASLGHLVQPLLLPQLLQLLLPPRLKRATFFGGLF